MKYNWENKKIGDVVDIRRGASPRPIHKYLAETGMPWVKIADATADDSRYIWKTKEHIINEGISRLVEVEPETLIVSNSATPGLPKIMKINACVHDGWLVFSNYKGIIRDFLYYKFVDIRRLLVNQANGSVFQNLKTDIVREFDIDIPSIDIQKKIVAILSRIDEKIELNNMINNNLEEQAMAIFKYWFVDFEPFGGNIPDDWQKYMLKDFLPVITGKKNANVSSSNGLYPFFSCSQDIMWTNKYSFEGNAILVAGNGDFNVKFFNGKFEAYQRTYVLIPKNPQYSAWLFYAIKYNLNKITLAARGSVIKFITKRNLENFSFYAPINLDNFRIIDYFSTINNNIASNREENIKLSKLRDILLPKLMSGELDVSKIDI